MVRRVSSRNGEARGIERPIESRIRESIERHFLARRHKFCRTLSHGNLADFRPSCCASSQQTDPKSTSITRRGGTDAADARARALRGAAALCRDCSAVDFHHSQHGRRAHQRRNDQFRAHPVDVQFSKRSGDPGLDAGRRNHDHAGFQRRFAARRSGDDHARLDDGRQREHERSRGAIRRGAGRWLVSSGGQ